MKSYSNTYIFIFASVLVIVVAALLSFVSMQLKPLQEKNIEIATKHDILKSVELALDADEQDDKQAYIEELYDNYITKSIVINSKGEEIKGVDAFNVDLKVELSKDLEERNLPVFFYTDKSNNKKYIIPVRGKGLWGPIWGYVSLNDDLNTIFGATFAHKGETPGLGAEIETPPFQEQFKNKKLFKDGEFISIEVMKGGGSDSDYAVDAISGGTITSKGVEAMLYDCLISYKNYFNEKRN